MTKTKKGESDCIVHRQRRRMGRENCVCTCSYTQGKDTFLSSVSKRCSIPLKSVDPPDRMMFLKKSRDTPRSHLHVMAQSFSYSEWNPRPVTRRAFMQRLYTPLSLSDKQAKQLASTHPFTHVSIIHLHMYPSIDQSVRA